MIHYYCTDITKDLINKFKSSDNLLRHVDPRDKGKMLITMSGKLIGYIAWDKGTITALEVLKDFQGNGFSKILLEEALKEECSTLTVNRNNKKAIEVYEHLGWKYAGQLGPKMLIYVHYNKI